MWVYIFNEKEKRKIAGKTKPIERSG